MSTSFWWVFDLLTVLIAVYVIVTNAKRGLTKSLVLGIGYVITTVIASLTAAIAAPSLYQTVAYDNNINGIITANKHMDFVEVFSDAINAQEYGFVVDNGEIKAILSDPQRCPQFDSEMFDYASQKTGGPVSQKSDFTAVLQDAFIERYGEQLNERLPHYVRMYFEKQVRRDPQMMRDLIATYYDDTKSLEQRADVLEKLYASAPTTQVLQIFMYLISFSVFMVIVAFISAVLQNRLFFNIQNSTDHSVGALIGILEAVAMLVLLTLIVRLVVLLTGEKFLFFNEATIAESKLFSFLYNHLDILL